MHWLSLDEEYLEGISLSNFGISNLQYDELLAMVQHLPPSYRAVFNLFVIDGYSHEEIGGLLKISEGTSKSHLAKARMKLKKMITLNDLDEYEQNFG